MVQNLSKENIFGDKKTFALTCKITSIESDYIFCTMSLYLNGNCICDNNMASVLSYILGYVEDFFKKYENNEYQSNVLSYAIENNSITQVMNEYTESVLEYLENDVESENPTISEIDKLFLDFEWEAFSGCMLHFVQEEKKEWLLVDTNRDDNYAIYKLESKVFYTTFKDFYRWAVDVIKVHKKKQNQ